MTRWQVTGTERAGSPVTLASGETARAMVRSDAAREVVLRLGAGRGVAVTLNGKEVFSRSGERRPLPDADAVLVQLRAGDNEILVRAIDEGEVRVWARVTDTRGLPVSGVSLP